MSEKPRKLTDSEIAFVKEQARLLAADLAFYARGPVRLHLIGGDQYAFTIDTGGGGSFIDMYLNPKVLFDIRNRERAIEVWRGMGVHELAHHLWPAKEQYKQAKKQGGTILVDMLNLLDDEQNERNARSMNPDWGRYLQTTAAWVFRGKNSSGDEYHHKHAHAGKGGLAPAGSADTYVARRNEFAYHLRRNLPGARDPVVAEALGLVPRNLKNISKAELLELARKVVTTLARGVELPAPVTVAAVAGDPDEKAEAAGSGKPISGRGPTLPSPPSSWKTIRRSVWSYVGLAAFVVVWFAFFARHGLQGWDAAFWVVLAVAFGAAAAAGIMVWTEHRRRTRAAPTAPGGGALPGRWETARGTVKQAWHRMRDAVRRRAGAILDGIGRVLDRVTPEPVARALASAGGLLKKFFVGGPAVLAIIVGGIWWLLKKCWSGIRWAGRTLWNSWIFRMFVLGAPIAFLLAMIVAVLLKLDWWMLVILLLLLLLLLLIAWLFRKKVKAFLKKVVAKGEGSGGVHGDDYDDSAEMLEFNVITRIVPVAANEALLRTLLPDVIPLSQEMRRYMEQCGRVAVDKEDEEVGHDLVEDLERAALGETALCVDEEKKPAASVHIEMIIDCSGSMQGNKILLAQRFGLLMEESIRGVRGITAHIWGFTDTAIYDCGQPGQFRVSGLVAGGGNNDAGALWHAYQSAKKSGKQLKILLMVSDGRPTECTWGSLYNLVSRLEAAGYVPVQVAVDHIKGPAFKRYFVDLVGQPMAAAVIQFGRMLFALVDER